MIDYERKAKVLNNGLYVKYVDVHKAYFYDWRLRTTGLVSPNCTCIDVAKQIEFSETFKNLDDWRECSRLYVSRFKKVKRLKDRIHSYMRLGQCLFLTLTFTNDVLSSTSEVTRRSYVRRFLKDNCIKYVANIDFGKKNGREHYHAFVVCDFIDPHLWSYGSLNVKSVPNNIEDAERIGKYVGKITYHALKVTNKRQALIYSR